MTTIKENDILLCTWGWECTRPTFYEVIKVQNGYVTLIMLQKERVSYESFTGTAGSGTEMPTNNHVGVSFRKIIKYSEERKTPYVKLSNYEHAYLWDGKPAAFDYRNI